MSIIITIIRSMLKSNLNSKIMKDFKKVSEEECKMISNLNNEITQKIKDLTNIMSKYIDIQPSSELTYSVKRKKNETDRSCSIYEVDFGSGIGCYDECIVMCSIVPC